MNEKKPLSLVIIVLGIAMFFSYHIYYHFMGITNNNLVENYYKKEEKIENNQMDLVKKISNEEELNNQYTGILNIPKINLETGFFDINNKKNNVNNSVTLLKESIMPGNGNSIIYLAAHSGVGYLAFFKNLNKLTNNDMIFLNYNNKRYSYIITDIYEMPKNGKITVNRNINEEYLVLTTCSKNENMQLVVVSKLLNII